MTGAPMAASSLRFERIEIRPRERRLLVDRQDASLGARAFDVLLALVERRDRMVPKSELLDVVWPDTIVEENNLQVHISALRKLLGQSAIATIPGRGYRFTLTPHDDAPAAPTAHVREVPARPSAFARTNVPAAVETLVGRDADVTAVTGLLASQRLVTVLGPGGIGKTRLALDVARAHVGRNAHGAWWVDLASTTQPERLAATIANAANIQLGEGDALARLSDAMAQLELLVVLDNCEHLVADVARVVHAIVARAPRVTLLATSQIALKLPAERVYRLDTLETPSPGTNDLATARRAAAVELFERRARAADRRFELTQENVGAAIAICRSLEGVALAIEMAAARVPFMGVDAVRARLDDRFRMLAASNRVADGRHQTLLATLDWSHALLSPQEQRALRRIGVFVGSFALDAARTLVAGDDIDEWTALDALGGLVDKSLLHVEQLDPPRYRLLETTRLYALDRLRDAGEFDAIQARHAEVMSALAARATADSLVMTDEAWSAAYGPDYQDLQAAFEFAVHARRPREVAHTCTALRNLDIRRGNVSGLRGRMAASFSLVGTADGIALARLWDCVMPADQIAIDAIPRLEVARNRLAAWRAQNDMRALFAALLGWAEELARAGDFSGADAALDEAQALARPDWPLRLTMTLASHRGGVAMHRKDADGYRHYRREVLRLAEQVGATRTALGARVGLGDAALMAEDYDEAVALCRAVADDVRRLNRPFTLGIVLENLSNALVHLGDLRGAADAAAESLPLMRQNEAGADVFNIVALIAARAQDPQRAARMLGHVDAWVQKSQYELAPNEARAALEACRAIDAAIGAAEHARLRAEGAAMSDDEADALAHAFMRDLTAGAG